MRRTVLLVVVTGRLARLRRRRAEAWHAPAQGHVGLFAGLQGDRVHLLGGNQGNTISIAAFPVQDVLGARRLA